MKIILLNGPPGCGKDYAARALRAHYQPTLSFVWEKFNFPHKLAFAALTRKSVDPEGNVDYYETNKGEVIPWLGVSYRQWQIDFSEKFMKPVYGDEIFSHMLLDRIRVRLNTANYLCAISDCGFQVEVDVLLRACAPDQVLLLRISRDNTSFANDSRSWVHGGPLQFSIHNSGLGFADDILRITEEFVNGK